MPKELKKRGRRAEKQRRTEDDKVEPSAKRQKLDDFHADEQNFDVSGDAGDDFISFGTSQIPEESSGFVNTFYGLLTEEEQEYYANINNKINANDFESDEERNVFIEAVYRETAGKEIKIASSQSCSRYLEKIILLSTPLQLQSLFRAFLEDLGYLVQHRFGSHCVETLFTRSASFVKPKSGKDQEEDSFESLYLEATKKLQENIGFLLTERFASHTVRVLLLVLSGQPLEDPAAKHLTASRKKENPDVTTIKDTKLLEKRKVPASFHRSLQELTKSAVSSLDTTYLRALATQPVGSPVLQVLLRIELTTEGEEKEQGLIVFNKLLPDKEFDVESETGKFVSSLVYDSTGAHLAETIVQCLPGKAFKKMYKNLFRDRIGKLAKNEIASYVAASILKRIGKDDLTDAMTAVIPELPGLVERNRLAIIRTLIERCSIRGVIVSPLKQALQEIYGSTPGCLSKMLKLQSDATQKPITAGQEDSTRPAKKPATDLQGSLLAQSMLQANEICTLIQESLLALDADTLATMSKDPVASRVIQVALESEQSLPQFLRTFVPNFYAFVSDLVTDVSGSHVVDALWTATTKAKTHFMKERIATILSKNETVVRESIYGRNVWRNWSMDLFSRRPQEWRALAKSGSTQDINEQTESKPVKSAIQLARERYASRSSEGLQHQRKASQLDQKTAIPVT